MISFTYILHDQEKKIDIESLNGYDLSNLHLHRLSHNDKYQYSFCNTHSIGANFFKTTFRSVNFLHSIFEQCYFNESNFLLPVLTEQFLKKALLIMPIFPIALVIQLLVNAVFLVLILV